VIAHRGRLIAASIRCRSIVIDLAISVERPLLADSASSFKALEASMAETATRSPTNAKADDRPRGAKTWITNTSRAYSREMSRTYGPMPADRFYADHGRAVTVCDRLERAHTKTLPLTTNSMWP
jgi:hypothetical protein